KRLDDRRDLHEIRPCASDDVDQHAVHAHAPSSLCTSILIRLTSMTSSSGMGDGAPPLIASTNALAHTPCPLSWLQRCIFLNPFHPQARNFRKLSSCRTLPAQNTSSRSFGNPLSPLAR